MAAPQDSDLARRGALALSILVASVADARAQPGGASLEVLVARDDAALTALVAPGGGAVTVCAGDACPSPFDRVDAEHVRVGTAGRRLAVDADVRVRATLPLVGARTTTVAVRCEGEPATDAASVLHLRDVECDAGSVPGISSVLGALLARDLESRTVDTLAEIHRGALERHSTDRRLTTACAPACATSASLVQPLESGGHAHVVVRVTVGPASCCP